MGKLNFNKWNDSGNENNILKKKIVSKMQMIRNLFKCTAPPSDGQTIYFTIANYRVCSGMRVSRVLSTHTSRLRA